MGARNWWRGGAAVVLGAWLLAGCATLRPQPGPPPAAAEQPALPGRYQLRVGPRFVFLTDFELKRDLPLLKELEGLEDQVTRTLRLPPSEQLVKVYIFADRHHYERYMDAHFKNLPARRAFFMARADERFGDELMVFAFWGPRLQEDLRHELTHALLHSVLKGVPMWLDEGLAEYFEVPPHWQGVNHRHLAALRSTQPGVPWTPDLARLERLTLVKDMTPADYREAWAWVHFLLHSTPQARSVLLAYLHDLQAAKAPGPFEPRLAAVIPSPETALRQHIAKLEASRNLGTLADPLPP
jgi:hypothetical protein